MSDLTIATLKNWGKTLADNVTANSPILSKIKELKGYITLAGGDAIEEGVEYAENGTFKWYSGFEALDISESAILTSATFAWKQASTNVIMTGLEKRANKDSETRREDLLAAKMTNAEHTMKNNVSQSLFSDGTGSSGKEIGGLQLIVSDAPATTVVGGIDASTNAWWRNQVYSLATDGGVTGGTPTSDQFLDAMEEMLIRTTRGSDSADLIVMDANHFRIYKKALRDKLQITSLKIGDASFQALEFNGKPVVLDAYAPANHTHFLNCKYLKLKAHEDANFSLDEERIVVDKDGKVYPMLCMGNLTCSNRNLQGVIKA